MGSGHAIFAFRLESLLFAAPTTAPSVLHNPVLVASTTPNAMPAAVPAAVPVVRPASQEGRLSALTVAAAGRDIAGATLGAAPAAPQGVDVSSGNRMDHTQSGKTLVSFYACLHALEPRAAWHDDVWLSMWIQVCRRVEQGCTANTTVGIRRSRGAL